MAYQSLGLGSAADDGTGDNLRAGGTKINANFSEIYTLFGTGTALTSGITCGQDDLTFVGSSYNVVWDKSASAFAFADNAKAIFGTGGDFEIYHSTDNNTYLTETGSGNLHLRASNLYLDDHDGTRMLFATENGAVALYHNGSVKLATSASGVSVTGSLVASSSVEVGAYIIFEGSTDNDNETTVQVVDPSADRTITIPDETGTLMTTGGTGNVTTAMLADNSVTAAKIAAGAVGTSEIADGSIATADIADDAITSAKIADNAIITALIVDAAVTSAKIADGTIVAQDLADGAVNSAKILDGTIATADIADNAVATAKIPDNAITAAKIASNAVTQSKMADDSVGSAELNTLSTLLIKNSSGTTLKTCHCAGA